MRTYERLKNDIQTYENNIGFLSISSKGGGGLVKEMNRKIDSLKEELDLIVKKIEVIDENFEK
jgi:archaellum component FlaC